jgi:uncharacterized protein
MEMQDKSISIMVDLSDVDPTIGFDISISRPFTDFFQTENNLEAVGDMEANLHVTVSGDDYFVSGRAAGRVKAKCGWCLKEYDEFIEAGINAPFVPKDAWEKAEAGSRGRETAEAAEEVVMGDTGDSDVYYYEGNGLELYTLLRDQLLLSLPVKQVCSEECKGLCQRCGTDLNLKSCGCPVKDADNRFAVLEQLKNKLKK